MSLPAMFLENMFCPSRKGRTGRGGWVHPPGEDSMSMSGLGYRKPLEIWHILETAEW